MKIDPGIVFYGTPEFAVASLDALVNKGFKLLAVVTAPDRPAGRGLKVTCSPVKNYALDHGLPVLQPENLKASEFIEMLHTLEPDLQVVVAFRMMPKEVWALPSMGTFNLHASLLPQYRGAAPINRTIINGETETGITTFLLDEKIDTGSIIFREATTIGAHETAGELHDRLMVMGAGLVVRTAEAIAAGEVCVTPQDMILPEGLVLKKAPRINAADCEVNWAKPADEVYNLIRGLSPYPGARSTIYSTGGDPYYIKIYSAIPEISSHPLTPGSVSTDGKTYMKIAVNDGWIVLTRVQLSGRKPAKIEDFLMGSGRKFL